MDQETANKKVLVAMSGGVDSSVSAALLAEQGYDVTGVFMRVGMKLPSEDNEQTKGCCSESDAEDAVSVAKLLGIPLQIIDFKADFERIIEYFVNDYVNGRTPNPCVRCNNWMKFGKLVELADSVGAEHFATGHYVRVDRQGERVKLLRGLDHRKDQSYFLFGVNREIFKRSFFPIGHLDKSEVRAEADRLGLPVTDKPDSVEICFVPDDDYARLVRERRPEAFAPGDVVDSSGKVLGKHQGIINFTLGQRRGLGIAMGKPAYVTRLDPRTNTVVLGPREELMKRSLAAGDISLFIDSPTSPIRCTAKIRYQHKDAPCTAWVEPDGSLRVDFEEPQSAITPGQAVVLYDGELVLGGGWIDATLD